VGEKVTGIMAFIECKEYRFPFEKIMLRLSHSVFKGYQSHRKIEQISFYPGFLSDDIKQSILGL